ncbi:MAG: hypothetical protein MUF42_01240 [Cytophagaceae bacterium]|jgi:hypothetical protein|nr:hypothetical protein [Cytophagaceae bacterium]
MSKVTDSIQKIAPRAWVEICDFYQQKILSNGNVSTPLDQLPFELAMGVYYRFFIENALEWDLGNIPYEHLQDTLVDVFDHYEKSLSHFS